MSPAAATPDNASFVNDAPFAFANDFLDDHAGHIISDPAVAIIELIANAYDAGATRVTVTWPEKVGDLLIVEDNGTGMTPEEFSRRWKTLKYNRLIEQGDTVVFPEGVRAHARKAFGRNGKGRHGAFCFSDEYEIKTRKAGQNTNALMSRSRIGTEPFHCGPLRIEKLEGHGTSSGRKPSMSNTSGRKRQKPMRNLQGLPIGWQI